MFTIPHIRITRRGIGVSMQITERKRYMSEIDVNEWKDKRLQKIT